MSMLLYLLFQNGTFFACGIVCPRGSDLGSGSGIRSCSFLWLFQAFFILFTRAACLPLAVLRNSKEFRAYSLTPGSPIQGPIHYDLGKALDSWQDDSSGYSSDEDDGVDIEVECDGSDFSDLTDADLFEQEQAGAPSPSTPSSSLPFLFSASSLLGRLLLPFTNPREGEVALLEAEAEDAAPDASSEQPETGLAARRKRKMARNKEKRRIKRCLKQEELGTRLKGIARRRAAESQKLDARDTFATESLPVSSGGWSGLRQKLEKLHPEIKELLDEHEMEVVEWNGR